LTGHGCRGRQREATGQLRLAHPFDQLQQRQGIAARVRHDPVTNALVEVAGDSGGEQRAGVVVGKSLDR